MLFFLAFLPMLSLRIGVCAGGGVRGQEESLESELVESEESLSESDEVEMSECAVSYWVEPD